MKFQVKIIYQEWFIFKRPGTKIKLDIAYFWKWLNRQKEELVGEYNMAS